MNFGNYKIVEENNKIILSNSKIKVLATNETIIPFKDWIKKNNKSEWWWTAYNHVKHNGFTNKEEGNLNNVIESLSALFLLNCIHKETQTKLREYGYIKIDRDTWETPLWSLYKTSQLFEI